MRALKYFFPKRRLQQKLPLLPLQYSSKNGPAVDPSLAQEVWLLKGHSVARTDQDALRLLAKHGGMTAQQIIKQVKRKRRFQPFMKTFWRRLKRIW